jgi:hypothetical protein
MGHEEICQWQEKKKKKQSARDEMEMPLNKGEVEDNRLCGSEYTKYSLVHCELNNNMPGHTKGEQCQFLKRSGICQTLTSYNPMKLTRPMATRYAASSSDGLVCYRLS